MTTTTPLAILVFPDAEVLDVMGPYEAFSLATHDQGTPAFRVRLAAREPIVTLRNGLRVVADDPLDRADTSGILLVPGGPGVRRLVDDLELREWIAARGANAECVLSVCTGAWLLGVAGLLHELPATTHHRTFDDFARHAPTARVQRGVRYVDAGRVLTSGGVSAGIDLALHVIERRLGVAARARVETTMEWGDAWRGG
ncbi:MAG: DJ-1/PfpI family protein [Phycisphaerae bacterium]|nr:DJ-1/PfpI family protein [Phycisphaerae bacterium]